MAVLLSGGVDSSVALRLLQVGLVGICADTFMRRPIFWSILSERTVDRQHSALQKVWQGGAAWCLQSMWGASGELVGRRLCRGVPADTSCKTLQAAGHEVTAFYLRIWFVEDMRNDWKECPWAEDLHFCDQVH